MSKTQRGLFTITKTGPAPGKQLPRTGLDLSLPVPDLISRALLRESLWKELGIEGRGGAGRYCTKRRSLAPHSGEERRLWKWTPGRPITAACLPDPEHLLWAASWGGASHARSVPMRIPQVPSQALGGGGAHNTL